MVALLHIVHPRRLLSPRHGTAAAFSTSADDRLLDFFGAK